MDARAVKSAGLGAQMMFSLPMIVGAMTPEERAVFVPTAPVPLRVLYRITKGRHARLVEQALGRTSVGVA
jgi:hypothetical protein